MTITSSPTTTNYKSQGFDQLRARVGGQVITPNDKSYDTARQAWNLTVDQSTPQSSLLPVKLTTLSRRFDLHRQRIWQWQ